MRYSQIGDTVFLEMSHVEYTRLMVILGFAVGSAYGAGRAEAADEFAKFIDNLNTGNADFLRYTGI